MRTGFVQPKSGSTTDHRKWQLSTPKATFGSSASFAIADIFEARQIGTSLEKVCVFLLHCKVAAIALFRAM